MEKIQKQEEMFPEIAKMAKEDIITERRTKHKSTSGIIDNRMFGKYTRAVQKERKAVKLKKIKDEIKETDPKKNPNWINLEAFNIRP